MKKRDIYIFIVLFALIMVGVVNAGQNGYVNSGTTDPSIVVGAVWTDTNVVPPSFVWDCPSLTFPCPSSSDPFTYTSSQVTSVYITDAFLKGDAFKIYDNSVEIGTTPIVAAGAATTTDPVVAYTDPSYSHGCFNRPAGDHSIEIETIQGLFAGGAYIMVLQGPCSGTGPISTPEFPSLFLPAAMIIGFLGTVLFIRRTREQ